MANDGEGGPSQPPEPKLPLDFQNGEPTKNKKDFVKACRLTVRAQIGLSVSSWDEIDDRRRYDLFRSMQQRFELEDIHFKYVMQLMCNQLKTWRWEIRRKMITKDMTVSDIRQLKSNNPLTGIPIEDWEGFIEREACEAKLSERERARENRSHYSDPHRLGTRSYNEFDAELRSKGIEADRAERYTLARTDKETGLVRPSFAPKAKKIAAERLSMDPLERAQIDKDPLSRVVGRDGHGRVRGVSSKMSKLEYKGFFSFGCNKKSSIRKDVMDVIETEVSPTIDQILGRLSKVERGRPSSSSSSASGPTSHASTSVPLSTPSDSRFTREVRQQHTPSSDSHCLYTVWSHITFEPIAFAHGHEFPIDGEIVNGVMCAPNECRIVITSVMEGKEMHSLYKPVGEHHNLS